MKVIQLALAVVLTCGASLGLVAMSWLRSASAAPFQEAAPPEPLVRARGVLRSVDLELGRVTVNVAGEAPVELQVTDETTVFVDGRMATMEDLQPGTSLCAAYEKSAAPVADWLEPCAR